MIGFLRCAIAASVLAAGAGGWAIWKSREPVPHSSLSGGSAEEAEKARQAQEVADAKKRLAAELHQVEQAARELAAAKSFYEKAGAIPTPATATKEKPFVNSLGMKFVPVPGTEVLFCIHETRSKDFASFIADKSSGYTMSGSDADNWRTYKYEGVSVGRGETGVEAEVSTSTHPVANVSWLDASAFCDWLSKKEGKTYRLPTDREWSIAVGIGDRENATSSPQALDEKEVPDVYPWAGSFTPSSISGNYADSAAAARFGKRWSVFSDYTDGFATTAPVMTPAFSANQRAFKAHGIYDMGGNAWEWVAGCYDGTDPQGQNKILTSIRALRGGSWKYGGPAYLLSSARRSCDPGARDESVGFRVVVAGSGG